MGYGIAVVILGLLILIHELGHLAAAKWAKIPIERFSVGFGPRLWGFKKSGTDYWLALIPFGGYVLPRVRDTKELSVFPLSRRVLFCLGGPAANIMAALVCLSVANSLIHGLSWTSTVTGPFLGLCTAAGQIVSAIPVACKDPGNLSGIVGIVALAGQKIGTDIARLFIFAAFMNLNLAIFNMLPIPPLDGGRIAWSILERCCGSLTRWQTPAAITGWVFMAVLMCYTTAVDLRYLLFGLNG